MNFEPGRTHFELFGLPARYALDTPSLERAFRELQAAVHPDRYASAPESEKRLSMQWATLVNEAYQTLRHPLRRAAYLLSLAGVDPQVETNTAMPAAFLVAQMELREELEEASAAGDVARLEALEARARSELDAAYVQIGGELDRAEHQAAAATLRRVMFLDRLREQAGDAIERAEA